MIISKNNNQIHKFAYPVLQRPVEDIQPMITIFSLPQKPLVTRHTCSMTILQLRSLVSRLWSATPSLTRSINRTAFKPVPSIRDPNVLSTLQFRSNYLESIKSPADFLKAIGRSCETKMSVELWEDFWKMNGPLLKKDGVPVRDRRY